MINQPLWGYTKSTPSGDGFFNSLGSVISIDPLYSKNLKRLDTNISKPYLMISIDFIRNKYFINGYKSRVNEKMGKQPIPVTHGVLQGTLAFLLEQINQSWGQIFIRIDSHNKLLILRRLSVIYFE